MSWYKQQLEDWLRKQDVKADVVFDIGGKQGPVRERVRSWDVGEYKILDLPEFDLNKYSQHVYDMKERADIVFCLEVFEYLYNPLAALDLIQWAMKKGGKAYVTFAFVYPHHNELELEGLRYTEPAIRRLAEHVGLNVTWIGYRTDKSRLLQSFYQADGMHPSKQYDHHDVTGFIVEFTK